MKIIRRSLVAALAAFALVLPSQAQFCGVDDGFVGPCCAPAAPAYPVFPTLTLGGLGGSFNNCNLDCQWNTTVTIAPNQVLCDYWLFGLSITGATPADPTIPGAVLLGKYARTWQELTPLGPIQVWRWLVNGDLPYGALPSSATLCKYPFATMPPTFLPAHYSGNIDYAFNCATGTWEVSMALTHLCVYEVHGPLSAVPLPIPAVTPPRTYHFVAPANFVFGPGPSPVGPILADAERESNFITTPYTCLTENPIVQGFINDVFLDCHCGAPTPVTPPLYHHQNLFATVVNCGVALPIISVPIAPVLPTGLRFQNIGAWIAVAGGQNYPGPMNIGHYMGLIDSPPMCIPPGALGTLNAVSGVGTVGGYGAFLYTSPAGTIPFMKSIDLGNILTLPSLLPALGTIYISDRVWSMNTP
jgi:hypothetical protein